MKFSKLKTRKGPTAEELGVVVNNLMVYSSALASLAAGFYQGYTGSNNNILDAMYVVPFTTSAGGWALGNILSEAQERSNVSRPLRKDYHVVKDGTIGAIGGSIISGVALGIGYALGDFMK